MQSRKKIFLLPSKPFLTVTLTDDIVATSTVAVATILISYRLAMIAIWEDERESKNLYTH